MKSKPFWQSKTLWFNCLSILIVVLEMTADLTFIPPGAAEVIMIVIAAVNVALRLVTRQPVSMDGGHFVIAMIMIGALTGGCSALGYRVRDPGVLPALIPIDRIADPDTAKRALLIAQDVRVAARDWVASKVRADGVVDSDELATIAKFDRYDDAFTTAWRYADQAVVLWSSRRADADAQTRFAVNYEAITDLLTPPTGMRDWADLRSRDAPVLPTIY